MFNIEKFRNERNLGQIEFALKIGIKQPQLSKLESGKFTITNKFLKKIEDAFDVDLSEFKTYSIKEVVLNEPNSDYVDYKAKYLQLLEQYQVLSDKLTNCLESKIK